MKWSALTSSMALLVYWLTLAPDLTWAHAGSDGPELITAAVTLGVPHPPGYPLYVLLGKLVSHLPIGTVAHRFNLFSALAMAVAAGFVCQTAWEWGNQKRPLSAIATGLTFAFTPLVWGQATITEVYALNAAFIAAFLWALLSQQSVWLAGTLAGLSVTTHLTSLLLLPLALVHTPWRKWSRLGTAVLLGLTPFLTIPWLARTNSPVLWGQPDNLSGWWWVASARIYRPNVFALPLPEWSARWQAWQPILSHQLAGIGWIFIPVGFWQTYKKNQWRAITILGTAVLYGIYAFTYTSHDAWVFLLPALLLLCLLISPTLHHINHASLTLPLLLLLLNFNGQNLRQDWQVRTLLETNATRIPANAIVITPGDETIFTLWYWQHVENQRPDLIVIDGNLMAFDWYRQHLQQREPSLQHLAEDDVPGFVTINSNQFLVCGFSLLNRPPAVPNLQPCIED